ncbi:serine hydrolase domain-containing protein [uncultured Hoeflea sp.]|uniref:serine hydrolase domain-containing protein n=1 Tax=uncultured Hoeflea sp. TaxID=538666 RepID=UPI00260B1EA8|nr:serine hydrolase domain-containing protein [uncultured Hoeflea sp.]
MIDQQIQGHVATGWEPVRAAFRQNFASGAEIGAAVAVQHRGEMVVDLWGGVRDPATGAPWEKDTMVIVFSATKGVAGLVMAYAHSNGWIDYEARVAKYWPEFAQNGKEDITLRQLLSHQAGLHAFHQKVDREVVADPHRLALIMEAERPQWPPGQHYAYHIISLGFYEAELIRRTDPRHRTLGQVFHEDIAASLGLDFYIRLPPEVSNSRLAPVVRPGIVSSILGLPPAMIVSVLNPWSHIFRSTMINPGTTISLDSDTVYARDLEVPAGGGVGTARALAALYGEYATGGKRLGIGRKTLYALEAPAIPPSGGTMDMSLRGDVAYSLGFMKPCDGLHFGSPSAFGTPGAGGSMGFADPGKDLGYGYVMNRMGTGIDPDPRDVALREAIAHVLA